MTNKLLDPLGLLSKPLGETAATQKNAETARWENTRIGICPACSKPMKQLEASGINTYTCLECCVCLPTENN